MCSSISNIPNFYPIALCIPHSLPPSLLYHSAYTFPLYLVPSTPFKPHSTLSQPQPIFTLTSALHPFLFLGTFGIFQAELINPVLKVSGTVLSSMKSLSGICTWPNHALSTGTPTTAEGELLRLSERGRLALIMCSAHPSPLPAAIRQWPIPKVPPTYTTQFRTL